VILAVDVGGSHVKFLVSGDGFERRRFESGPNLTASEMVEGVARAVVPVEPEALDQGDSGLHLARLGHRSGLVELLWTLDTSKTNGER
jgi:hypothetical protein